MDSSIEKKMLLDEKKQRDINYYMPEKNVLEDLANFFSIFADATRIKILSALSVSEMCVNDIASVLELNQTTVSHQLKSLKTVGAVKYRRDGKIIFYSIADNVINDCLLNGVNYLYN
ncbi:MAG: metalloregulator ArsR/SmtB family transcription factor [Clostridia bacterium]|nr:metalloregulator ArsR/SmtB family transcription factor [Clostridia bacterium]